MAYEQSVWDNFEVAIQGELYLRSIYLGFAEKFSAYPKAKAFWEQLADDERQHAKSLTSIRDSLTEEQLSAPADPSMLNAMERITRLSPEAVLEDVLNLQDAFEAATDLESGEVNKVFDFLVKNFLHEGEEPLELIISKLDQHIAKLTTFSAKFGSPSRRMLVLAAHKGS